MITIYANPFQRGRLALALLMDQKAQIVTAMSAFEENFGRSDGGVVCVDVPSPEILEWLVGVAEKNGAPLAVLVDLTPYAVIALWPLRRAGFAVVWNEEARKKLRPSLGLGVAADPLVRLLEDLQGGDDLAPIIRQALALIFETEGPPQSFRSLADSVSVAPSTLRHHWQVAMGELSPKELIDWVTLLRAVASRGEPSWASVAHDLGRHSRTLERLSVRLTGETLNSLRGHPLTVLASLDGWMNTAKRRA